MRSNAGFQGTEYVVISVVVLVTLIRNHGGMCMKQISRISVSTVVR